MAAVNPFGPIRDDMRAAWVGAFSITSQSSAATSEEDTNAIIKQLRTYLKCQENHDDEIDYDALKQLKGLKGPTA